MEGELLTTERQAVLAELQRVFDVQTSEVLMSVLERAVAWGRDGEGVRREDFGELKQIVARLAEAQARTEAAVERLAEAQARTEERVGRLEAAVERLAEAQARTEERVGRLEAAVERLAEAQARAEERLNRLEVAVERLEAVVERLAEAQARTEASVEKLAKSINQLRAQVGGLSDNFGGDIEDIAYIVLHDVLTREFGWEVGVLERQWQTWGREPEEVNIFGQAQDPARPEQTIWIVGEAKHNLTLSGARRFAKQVKRARQHLKGEVFPVCFCYRARPEVRTYVQEAGMRLVFSYGKLL